MYYTADEHYQLAVATDENTTETKNVFVTLISADYVSGGVLNDVGMKQIAETNGTAIVIARDGDVNGDTFVNIADANVVYQMVIHGGSYYGELGNGNDQSDILSRLEADMSTAYAAGDHRGTTTDVDTIVNQINGVVETTNP